MSAPRPGTALDATVDRYLQWKRALGRGYDEVERVLVSLLQFMHDRAASDLDQNLFDEWSKSFAGLTANVRRNRQREVRNFCLYRQRTEPGCFVPDANRFPRPRPYCAPVIFGPEAVRRMLAIAAQQRPTPGSPLLPTILRLAVVLLYTAGLRRGELLRLTLADADPTAGVLRIRESKFHKSRFVPLSPDACRELRAYLQLRLAPPLSTAPDSPLLCNTTRGLRAYTGTGLSRGLKLLIRSAKVQSPDGRWPRVHDFRHSFAVQALLRWYRQGADVQSNLPKLAMYMGHVSIVSTAYYLKWIPDIAAVASDRFEARFGYLISGEDS
ncbi:tyrosine-type recombinase/integrase [Burkholderia ubonensis]|uniref:tyrosine-type recombinase/integrase n=1 Tax=Burkholderia ubonensis TaxID=101571 RepID=UPI00075AB1C6|nr:tyrosine-type recombinase/integrase [Burkholderia ubonensis]KVN92729.1 integrase [Burkholderia ubonensis]KVZ50911.1 integrase [Burkholderia ubonensis]